ncbi:glutathione S-transferase family protein [Jiella avicenniae]|uniref:Glutathione S-transferase family protein n=1 Tax=Jiella avicenniae TaxID=2907202 RepID=A0A9X1T5Z4_9HYPH|nr:glutathione S-transferase family protein [Jiella avicenniae]MCE7029742.1 glutathione S-transferase family protein [Jiella avicenniae]
MQSSSNPQVSIVVTAYDWVPSFAQGYVRDLRVRWALNEAKLPYEARLIDHRQKSEPEHLARQPFGQVPAIDMDGGSMFESGAIVWTIAEASDHLLPKGPAERRQALTWSFAALNTVEPVVARLVEIAFFLDDEELKAKLRPGAVSAVETRLAQLQAALGERDFLVGEFFAPDILMATVLRNLGHGDVLAGFPALERYLERCLARPAFEKALAEQVEPFARNAARYEVAA